jgi:hypothetical protein
MIEDEGSSTMSLDSFKAYIEEKVTEDEFPNVEVDG